MTHAVYRVVGYEVVGPSTLRVEFDDDTAQVMTSGRYCVASCMARSGMTACSGRS